MPRASTITPGRNATLFAWLAEREARALAAGGTLPWTPSQPSYRGSPQRLAALQRGEPVDIPAGALPPQARPAVTHWWSRAVVDPGGRVEFYDDDGSVWLAENGLG